MLNVLFYSIKMLKPHVCLEILIIETMCNYLLLAQNLFIKNVHLTIFK